MRELTFCTNRCGDMLGIAEPVRFECSRCGARVLSRDGSGWFYLEARGGTPTSPAWCPRCGSRVLWQDVPEGFLDLPLEDLDLSVRPYNCLKRAGVNDLGDLVATDLSQVRNLGRRGLEEVRETCARIGVDALGEVTRRGQGA